jgi:hypothetical protein
MTLFHRNSPYLALLTLGPSGLLAIAVGALAMESRHSLAASLMGGSYFLGVPIDRADLYKLLAVSYTSLEIGLVGVAMIVAGVMLSVSRLLRDQVPSPASAGLPSNPQGERL